MKISPDKLSQNAEQVAALLKQLANKNRLMILCSLAEKELSVGELNTQIPLSQSALSQHLAKLRDNGLVSTRRESQTIYYHVDNPKLQHLLKANACINGDLVAETGLAQATVSQHLRELKEQGIIQGTIEGVSVSYCINPVRWSEISKLLNGLFEKFKQGGKGCC